MEKDCDKCQLLDAIRLVQKQKQELIEKQKEIIKLLQDRQYKIDFSEN